MRGLIKKLWWLRWLPRDKMDIKWQVALVAQGS